MFAKEIQSLYLQMKDHKYKQRGQVVMRENDEPDKVVIIRQGQFEIVKTDIKNIFFNEATAVVGVKEKGESGALIKSSSCIEPESMIEETGLA